VKLQGKVAVITGGTSGIGEATAQVFVSEGCRVAITGRSVGKGQAIVERLGDNAIFIAADVTREDEVKKALDFAVAYFGKLDIVFNNAGAPTKGHFEDITQQDFTEGVQLLLGSVVFSIKHAIPLLKANGGGVIINNASIAGLRYGQGACLYSALKAAVAHYTRLAGVELGQHNIRVNSISPGAIATPIFWGGSARANTLSAAENQAKQAKLEMNLARATPLPSSGLPRDIAYGALYLASDEGRYVNCHDLVIDGGRIEMFNERN
jgi:NAD(P)-dependent dehydrogenase (short-subunit alcohol dehydrogenase family)